MTCLCILGDIAQLPGQTAGALLEGVEGLGGLVEAAAHRVQGFFIAGELRAHLAEQLEHGRSGYGYRRFEPHT